jgi:hypothetical protein
MVVDLGVVMGVLLEVVMEDLVEEDLVESQDTYSLMVVMQQQIKVMLVVMQHYLVILVTDVVVAELVKSEKILLEHTQIFLAMLVEMAVMD